MSDQATVERPQFQRSNEFSDLVRVDVRRAIEMEAGPGQPGAAGEGACVEIPIACIICIVFEVVWFLCNDVNDMLAYLDREGRGYGHGTTGSGRSRKRQNRR